MGWPIESLPAVTTYMAIAIWYIFIWAAEGLGLEKMPLWVPGLGSALTALIAKLLFV